MTQYATPEKRYKCCQCEISCTKREMIHSFVTSLKCPNCRSPMIYRSVKEMIEDIRTDGMNYDEIRNN